MYTPIGSLRLALQLEIPLETFALQLDSLATEQIASCCAAFAAPITKVHFADKLRRALLRFFPRKR